MIACAASAVPLARSAIVDRLQAISINYCDFRLLSQRATEAHQASFSAAARAHRPDYRISGPAKSTLRRRRGSVPAPFSIFAFRLVRTCRARSGPVSARN